MQIDSFDVIPSWRYHQKNYHCIVFSVVLLNGISFYVIWVLVLCTTFFFSILLFSFNSSQSRFSPFRRGYSCGSSCVGIRVEMSWVLFPFLVLEKKNHLRGQRFGFLMDLSDYFHFADMDFLVDIDSEVL